MKRGGLLNPELARAVASLGHGDLIVLADAGLPTPRAVERIDLAFAPGKPSLLDVLEAVLAEMEVERPPSSRAAGRPTRPSSSRCRSRW